MRPVKRNAQFFAARRILLGQGPLIKRSALLLGGALALSTSHSQARKIEPAPSAPPSTPISAGPTVPISAGPTAPSLSVDRFLSPTESRSALALHVEKEQISFWSCSEKCAASPAQVAVKIPFEARTFSARVEKIKLREQEEAFWIRYGSEQRYYSVLVMGGLAAGSGKAPSKPVLILTGWAGVDSKSKTQLELRKSQGGARLLLRGAPQKIACGREAPSFTRRLDPKKAVFLRVHAPFLTKKERAQALPLSPLPRDAKSSERLVKLGATPDKSPAVDADRAIAWSAGHQFVELQTPAQINLGKLAFDLAEPLSKALYFWVATETHLYRVDLPASPQTKYSLDVPLAEDEKCVAVIQPRRAAPIAELMGRIEAESPSSVSELVRKLESSDPGLAADELALLGASAASTLAQSYPGMSRLARARALGVAEQMPPGVSAPVYVAALEHGGDEARKDALAALRLLGEPGATAVATRFPEASQAGQIRLARALVELSPGLAAPIIVKSLSQGSPAQRAYLRESLLDVSTTAAGNAALSKLVSSGQNDKELPRMSLVELVRALGTGVLSWGPVGEKLVKELATDANFSEAYLLAPTVLSLAKEHAGFRDIYGAWVDGGRPSKMSALEEAALLSHVLELLMDNGDSDSRVAFQESVLANLLHGNVRVRVAALGVLAQVPSGTSADDLRHHLLQDGWPRVRTAAARVAGAQAGSEGSTFADLLSRSLKRDIDAGVRRASARALAQHGGDTALSSLRRTLKKDESFEVRAEATLSLGKLCDLESLDVITQNAQALARDAMGDGPIVLGLASVTALASLHPADLDKRLAPLKSKKVSGVLRNQVQLRLDTVQAAGDRMICGSH